MSNRPKRPRGRTCPNMDAETAQKVMTLAASRIKPCPVCGGHAWAGGNQNKMHSAGVEIDEMRYPIRRAAYIVAGGRPLKKDEVIFNTCEHPQCVASLKPVKKSAVPKILTEQGKIHNAAHRAAKAIALRARASNGIGIERARQIREATGTNKDIAAAFGISRQAASRIRLGQSYHEANPFSGLFRGAI